MYPQVEECSIENTEPRSMLLVGLGKLVQIRVQQRPTAPHWQLKWRPLPRLNIKMVFPGMVIPDKYKTVVRPSYFYNTDSYTGKTTYLYWDGLQDI